MDATEPVGRTESGKLPLVAHESDAHTVGSCGSSYARAAVGLYTSRSRVARAAWRM